MAYASWIADARRSRQALQIWVTERPRSTGIDVFGDGFRTKRAVGERVTGVSGGRELAYYGEVRCRGWWKVPRAGWSEQRETG